MIYYCDNCGTQVETVMHNHPMDKNTKQPDYQIAHGLALDLLGGYGMFNDDVGKLLGNEPPTPTILCHDCCAAVFRAIPNAVPEPSRERKELPDSGWMYVDKGKGGLHPYEGDEPCCEWGWN